MRQIVAAFDPALVARCSGCTPLYYGGGADPALDRPAYIRAASSLARVAGFLVVVQDDANFVALIEPEGGGIRAVALPAGAGGRRQFDDLRGNKRLKLDLEACTTIPGESGDLLLAFGSGSTPPRERILLVSGLGEDEPVTTLYEAPEFYAALRAAQDFSGSDMNIEGAALVDGRIRLFGRGNGARRDGLVPVDATCDVDWPRLEAHLMDPGENLPPRPTAIIQYDLGDLDGVRLGFTDAAMGRDMLLFSAAAEMSPDATRDGPVAGSVIGLFDAPDRLRWTELRDQEGNRYPGKVEGLLLASDTMNRAYVVVDRDDPARPSELCEVELSGPWHPQPV